MSDKTIKGLLIALVALLAVYGIFRFAETKSLKPKNPKGFNFTNIKEKNIDKIAVKNAKGNYELVKNNNKWQIDGKDIDDNNITQLWTSLQNTRVGSLATDKESEFSLYQVDDSQGKFITFYSKGKEAASYIFGKQNADFTSGYLRKPKSNKIYSVSGHIGSLFEKAKKEWFPSKKTSK